MDRLHHHHHHPQHQHHQQQPISVNVDVDRFPQWTIQETREFLIIRAELDRSFMETKRNKQLWEVISTRMKEKGYNRSPEQCKCKWKNLVTRYKGCETMEAEATRQQFPFYNDLQAIFSARMQSIQWPSEGEVGETGSKKKAMQLSSDNEENMEENELDKGSIKMKKKGKRGAGIGGSTSGSNNSSNNIKEILGDFMRQQMQIEMQWREAFEARENERRLKEIEWRQTMEALENERIMMDRSWIEREEQRRMRQEARAEKSDALITALLNKLRREGYM